MIVLRFIFIEKLKTKCCADCGQHRGRIKQTGQDGPDNKESSLAGKSGVKWVEIRWSRHRVDVVGLVHYRRRGYVSKEGFKGGICILRKRGERGEKKRFLFCLSGVPLIYKSFSLKQTIRDTKSAKKYGKNTSQQYRFTVDLVAKHRLNKTFDSWYLYLLWKTKTYFNFFFLSKMQNNKMQIKWTTRWFAAFSFTDICIIFYA